MSKRRKILTFIGVFLIIAIIGFSYLYKYVNSQKSGTITYSQPSTSTQPNFSLSPRKFDDNFVSFNYPSSLTKAPNNKLVNPVVDMANFTYSDIETWNLAIDILVIPSGSIADNNSYQVRQINPSQYAKSELPIGNHSVVVFSDKTTGYAKVAFLVNGKYQATISLTGDDVNGYGNLDATLKMILSTWQWKVS